MAGRTSVLAVLAVLVHTPAALHFDTAKNYPVTRVVKLLQDMKVQLEKEADSDEEIYSKLACWCTTNDKGKTASIAAAEARIADLDNAVERFSALSTSLSGEIEGLEKEIDTNQKSLDKATALRARQLAEFNAEEKEMLQAISALKSAVVVLSKHHDKGAEAALLNNKVILKALATAKEQMDKHAALLQGAITPSQKRTIAALVDQKGPTFAAYKPASGQIFGILKQMRETFEANLSNSQKEELASAEAFKDLKVAKEEEIAAGKESLEQKQQHLAKTDQSLAQAKEDKIDTQASLSADEKFLIELKKKCSMSDKEWEERQTTRNTELQAVAKAIAILSSDDARDQFSKTFNFLQVKQATQANRKNALDALSTVAAKSPAIAALAIAMRLDPFPKVKAAIDKMITALERESTDEVKHKDFCISELHSNEQSSQKKTHQKVNLEAKIAGLEQQVKEHKASIKVVIAEIDDLKLQVKRAGEDRAIEKKEFEGLVADQREAQALLTSALDALKKVYGDGGVVLAQARQEPPAAFSTYKKSDASVGVIALINQIIADAKAMEAEAVHDEEAAVEAYAKFVKTANEGLKAKDDAKVDLVSQKAAAEKDAVQAKSELDGTMTEIESLANGAAALHKSCDYTLKNFEVRQEARDQEVDALRKAKAFLSGMKS